MAIAPKSKLDHYEILSLLGKGGMGEVYLARDARLSRNVALKLLPVEFTQAAERIRRFEHEAKAASALNHPNILTIYEIGVTDQTHFIATEYIEGETLRQCLSREKPSLNTALEIATQMASALAAAHDAKIIHRDIKPENVMRRKDGIVKVLDFGLAKLVEMRNADFGMRNEEAETLLQGEPNNPQSPIPNPHSTDAGTVMGTASYMSPEQARGEKVDARSDLFSLGIVLGEILGGQRPFEGANMLDIVRAAFHQVAVARHADVPAIRNIGHARLDQRQQTRAFGAGRRVIIAQEKGDRTQMIERQPQMQTHALPARPLQSTELAHQRPPGRIYAPERAEHGQFGQGRQDAFGQHCVSCTNQACG